MNLNLTVSEFAATHGVDYATAMGTLRFLDKKNLISKGLSRSAKGGRGKPSTVFIVPSSITIDLSPVTALEASIPNPIS